MQKDQQYLIESIEDKPFYKRKGILIGISAAVIVVITVVIIVVVVTSGNKSENKLNFILTPYEESNEYITNPDQGVSEYVRVRAHNNRTISYWLGPIDFIYDLRVDISDFSAKNNGIQDLEINEITLEGIDQMLAEAREKGKNAIIRFAYDDEMQGNKDKECSMDMILKHVNQLGKILNNYPDVLTGIEASFFGPWGEMHSSEIVTKENINTLVDEWFKVITTNIPILVRKPKFVYNYLNKSKIEEMESIVLHPGDKGYYLGIWNDGMYANDEDYGTWQQNREKEIEWFKIQNDHLPYGGECEHVEETKYKKIEVGIPELFKSHLSFVRDNKIATLEEFQNQTYHSSIAGHHVFEGVNGLEFIKAHLGYRLVMTNIKVTIEKDNSFTLNIQIANNGFGFVNKLKKIGLVYSYDNDTLIEEQNDLGTYMGNQSEINIKGKLIGEPIEVYYVYLRLYCDYIKGIISYPIKLANKNVYNEKLMGNFIFKVDNRGKEVNIIN